MRFKKPSPALLVSIAALTVALGGTSYAAVSINGANIKAKSITSSKIKKDSLGSGVIKNGKLLAKDFKPGVLPAPNTVKPSRWLLVGADGTIKAQSGGFSLVAAYPTLPETAPGAGNQLRANGNVYISAGEDLTDNGIVASIQLQNTVPQNGQVAGTPITGRAAADMNPEFSGEIAVSRCNTGATGSATATGPTNCAPAGAQNANSFVVSPRMSDGTPTADATRKAFYVVVTG